MKYFFIIIALAISVFHANAQTLHVKNTKKLTLKFEFGSELYQLSNNNIAYTTKENILNHKGKSSLLNGNLEIISKDLLSFPEDSKKYISVRPLSPSTKGEIFVVKKESNLHEVGIISFDDNNLQNIYYEKLGVNPLGNYEYTITPSITNKSIGIAFSESADGYSKTTGPRSTKCIYYSSGKHWEKTLSTNIQKGYYAKVIKTLTDDNGNMFLIVNIHDVLSGYGKLTAIKLNEDGIESFPMVLPPVSYILSMDIFLTGKEDFGVYIIGTKKDPSAIYKLPLQEYKAFLWHAGAGSNQIFKDFTLKDKYNNYYIKTFPLENDSYVLTIPFAQQTNSSKCEIYVAIVNSDGDIIQESTFDHQQRDTKNKIYDNPSPYDVMGSNLGLKSIKINNSYYIFFPTSDDGHEISYIVITDNEIEKESHILLKDAIEQNINGPLTIGGKTYLWQESYKRNTTEFTFFEIEQE